MASFTSSSYYINDLLLDYSWTGTTGIAANVGYSYSVATTSSDKTNGLSGGAVLSAVQKTVAEEALQAWEDVANIHFNETNSTTAPITFRQATMPSGTAGWMAPTVSGVSTFSKADLVFDKSYNSNPVEGTYQYTVFLHEIGHALGLKHPGDYSGTGAADGPYLPASEDSTNVTVMSYYSGSAEATSGFVLTPMLYDIAAAQFLYGANTSYNAGNTTYSLTSAKTNMTLWDGGGTDTLDSTSYNGAVTLDLRAGKDDISRVGSSSTWIAFNANIENATSGAGSDTLYGNSLNNAINAGAGSDTLYGQAGSDNLHGGAGNDTVYGGAGIADTTDSSDVIYGEAGNDALYGNAGNDTLFGGAGVTDTTDLADTLYGGMGNDVIYGNAGNDVIYGGAGNDTLYGGVGSDIFAYTAGDGTDIIIGFRPEDDKLAISSSLASSILNILTHRSYNAIGALLDFGNNTSLTLTGLVPGSLNAENLVII